jgi:hypothetical protein
VNPTACVLLIAEWSALVADIPLPFAPLTSFPPVPPGPTFPVLPEPLPSPAAPPVVAPLGRLSAICVGVIEVTNVEGRFCLDDIAAPEDSGKVSERAGMSVNGGRTGVLAAGVKILVPVFVNEARAGGREVETPPLVKDASAGGREVTSGGGIEVVEVAEVVRSEVISFVVVSCAAGV